MGNIGFSELLVILLVVLLIFGARRIPELARSLGKASREFKNARDGLLDDLKETPPETPPEKKPEPAEKDDAGKES